MNIENKKIYKVLKEKLNDYNNMQDKILEIEETILNNSKGNDKSIKSKYSTSCLLENQVIKLLDNEEYIYYKAWKRVIDDLLIKYLKEPVKLKFLKRRYIDSRLIHYKVKGKIKDIDVIRDLECEGIFYDVRTWKRWKNKMLKDLLYLVKNDKILKNYKFL